MRWFGTAIVLLTMLSYNCVPVMAQADQPVAKGDSSDLPVTPKEMKQCMEAWDSFTQMSQREWAESCRRTLSESWQQDINPMEETPKKKGPGKSE